jgi:hypothetical protein
MLFRTVLLFCLCCPLALACTIPSYKADYTIYHNDSVVGTLATKLTRDKKNYKKTAAAKIKIFLFKKTSLMTSSGKLTSAGFAPTDFNYSDDSNKSFHRSLKNNVQDSISYTAQLQYLLNKGKRVMPLKVFMNKKMQHITFRVRAFPVLNINGQRMHTTYVVGDVGKGVAIHLWFVRKLNYLLVKSETVKDGKVLLDSELASYSNNAKCVY